jgi:hypothetical protein
MFLYGRCFIIVDVPPRVNVRHVWCIWHRFGRRDAIIEPLFGRYSRRLSREPHPLAVVHCLSLYVVRCSIVSHFVSSRSTPQATRAKDTISMTSHFTAPHLISKYPSTLVTSFPTPVTHARPLTSMHSDLPVFSITQLTQSSINHRALTNHNLARYQICRCIHTQ